MSLSVADFANRVGQALLSTLDGPTPLALVEETEAELGVRLPEEYRELVLTHGAGDFGLAWFYGAKAGHFNLVRQNRLPGRPSNCLAVSDNGCGDLYVLQVLDGRAGSHIWFLDHEDCSLTKTPYDSVLEFLIAEGGDQSS